jgi:hypothetical protein
VLTRTRRVHFYPAAVTSGLVQVFGRRHDEALRVRSWPASKKRQGTMSREVERRMEAFMSIDLARVRVSGPLSAFATGVADQMTRQGYSPHQTRLQLLLLNHLSNWLASEWHYYLRGRGQVALFGSGGRGKVAEFKPGDVAYIPQGFEHAIKNVGDEDLEIVQTWDNGKFEETDLDKWVKSSPRYLLANNFAGVTTITGLKQT